MDSYDVLHLTDSGENDGKGPKGNINRSTINKIKDFLTDCDSPSQ